MKKLIIGLISIGISLSVQAEFGLGTNFYTATSSPKYWSEKYQTNLPNKAAEERIDRMLDPANDPIAQDQKRARASEAKADQQIRRNKKIEECYVVMRIVNIMIINETVNDMDDNLFQKYDYCTKQPEIKKYIRGDGRYVKN